MHILPHWFLPRLEMRESNQRTRRHTNNRFTWSWMTQLLAKPLAFRTRTLARVVPSTLPAARVPDDFHMVVAPASAPASWSHGVAAGLQTLAGWTGPAPGSHCEGTFALQSPFAGAWEVVDVVAIFARPHLVIERDWVGADWAFVAGVIRVVGLEGRGPLHSFVKLIVKAFIEG
jgi:hypothetical protein